LSSRFLTTIANVPKETKSTKSDYCPSDFFVCSWPVNEHERWHSAITRLIGLLAIV